MNRILHILLFVVLATPCTTQAQHAMPGFVFYGDSIKLNNYEPPVAFDDTLSKAAIVRFFDSVTERNYDGLVDSLLSYKHKKQPDDWVFYQLIRKTAGQLSPKAANYYRYTLYKWYLLNKTGYDATLNIVGDRLLLYVQSNDEIYDIPCFSTGGKQYVCLNYHDYHYKVDFKNTIQLNIASINGEAKHPFRYQLTASPEFNAGSYDEKELSFEYNDVRYSFRVKINPEVKTMLANYPVTGYEQYFNMPLSKTTHNSLIPQLKANLKGMDVHTGIDYLLHFTRYAFLYTTDADHFGREKHLVAEETLLYDASDCEDRAALFYNLVKEIYNLPMVVVAFDKHLTIAVQLGKPVGKPIIYNGIAYSVCEPTPQRYDLPIGHLSDELANERYEIAFAYSPQN